MSECTERILSYFFISLDYTIPVLVLTEKPEIKVGVKTFETVCIFLILPGIYSLAYKDYFHTFPITKK